MLPTLCLALLGPAWGSTDYRFEDVAPQSGIAPYTMPVGLSAGVTAADYDDDGDVDLFVPNGWTAPSQLYRNDGSGTFTDVAPSAGVATATNDRAGLFFDADGDSRLDLLIANDSYGSETITAPSGLQLFQQRDPLAFDDVTVRAGLVVDLALLEDSHVGGLAAADVDRDGYLDLWVSVWEGLNYLYRNDGTGRFHDVTDAAGLGGYRPSWQGVFHDFDRDGRMDLFQAIDFSKNELWMNQGGLTFEDVAEDSGVDTDFNEMGVALGDWQNDGWLDVYVTNITTSTKHNVLFARRSGPTPRFHEMAKTLGVDVGHCGWGTSFFDADLDGWVELAATNGGPGGSCATDPSRFFHNAKGAGFLDVSGTVQFDDTYSASGLVAADLDRDGDPDLVQICGGFDPAVRVLENVSSDRARRNSLTIKPRQSGPNARAIGAVVRVQAGELRMTRLITAGTSIMGQEPAEALFGLGRHRTADRVVVEWPGGGSTELTDVAAGTLVVER